MLALSVPNEDYSRNAPNALTMISTFLLPYWCSLDTMSRDKYMLVIKFVICFSLFIIVMFFHLDNTIITVLYLNQCMGGRVLMVVDIWPQL